MNGFFNIWKPVGMSSAAVVAVMRRLTEQKRVGHAGTLDPEAAGVLPIMAGKATRLFDYLVDKEKEYEAVIAFGRSTDTQDATGETLETGDRLPPPELVREKALLLTGEIRQRPSVYSAIKVGGKPLYARARKGENPEVPERTVRVDSIEVLSAAPDGSMGLRVKCGKGTYIRTLCHDLGRLCGCPAHMRSLVRTRSGAFLGKDSIPLEDARELAAEGRLAERLIPPEAPLLHIPAAEIRDSYGKQVAAGARLPLEAIRGERPPEGIPVRVRLGGRFWGIGEIRQGQLVWRVQLAPEEGEEP